MICAGMCRLSAVLLTVGLGMGTSAQGAFVSANQHILAEATRNDTAIQDRYDGAILGDRTLQSQHDASMFSVLDLTVEQQGTRTDFRYSFMMARSAGNTGATVLGSLFLRADVDTYFLMSGQLLARHATVPGYVIQLAEIVDRTASVQMFENSQWSANSPDVDFTLGNSDGDLHNSYSPGRSGMLRSGNLYEFMFRAASVTASAPGDEGAGATGYFLLSFDSSGPISAVPEPASLTFWGVAGATISVRRRWRSAKQLH